MKVTAGAAANAKVIVYAVDGKGRADMRSLIFNGGVLTITAPVEEAPAVEEQAEEGGELMAETLQRLYNESADGVKEAAEGAAEAVEEAADAVKAEAEPAAQSMQEATRRRRANRS